MEKPNIDYIIKLSGNDPSIKQRLISVLKYELPLEADAYYVSMKQNKINQAVINVHKLKHKIAILGFEESYYLTQNYENELRKNKRELQPEFEKILTLSLTFVNRL